MGTIFGKILTRLLFTQLSLLCSLITSSPLHHHGTLSPGPEPSQFERVEQRLQSRASPTLPATRARGGQRGQRSRGAFRGATASPRLAITASQVAREEEDEEIDA